MPSEPAPPAPDPATPAGTGREPDGPRYPFDESRGPALHEPAAARRVPEAFVQDLWATQRFPPGTLKTTAGETVAVLDPGQPNPDGGPDFLGARLRLGGMAWAGDVEVHVTSGGWVEHRHDHDPHYNTVILHVALFSDLWTGRLHRADGTLLPELILLPHLTAPLRTLLHRFHTRPPDALPCADGWPGVPEKIKTTWIHHLARERLAGRRRRLEAAYLVRPDLEALLHERLFAALGYAPNAEPMQALARRLPLSLTRRVRDPLDLEALHFGTAGLLPDPAQLLKADRATADYVMDLRERFDRLRHTLATEVVPMDRTQWRFSRLRPANFPTLRIAQGVALLRTLLHRDPLGILPATLREADPVAALRSLLCVRPGPFWETHVRLDRRTRPRNPALGLSRADGMIVNAVVPVLLLLAEQTGAPPLEAALVELLERLPAEDDRVVRRYAGLGTRPRNALETQGLQQLYRTRCLAGHCLTCPVGRTLIEGTGDPAPPA
ncbi:DUF2851 family protein [Rhodocaloribacter litoris]|uniref:DUF2851 family protein n=1 Tax=Rhodocaloribacter litoris TaxID=2558931 RepID=UPI0014207695|nr:DUF2851 family protein [Rhodocaloribacter litoris]QXD15660.1 DUF2851 family protein [Rhodocaloribacter litoris]GIV61592.1 MAG: hypothetical protein KatS3mg044_0458 [Rhodothermaceae bacterium]